MRSKKLWGNNFPCITYILAPNSYQTTCLFRQFPGCDIQKMVYWLSRCCHKCPPGQVSGKKGFEAGVSDKIVKYKGGSGCPGLQLQLPLTYGDLIFLKTCLNQTVPSLPSSVYPKSIWPMKIQWLPCLLSQIWTPIESASSYL